MRRTPTSSSARGSALIFAMCIIFVLAVVTVALVRIAGADRTDAASGAKRDRGLVCAEAGLQYARRFFGSNYETTNGWNTYLSTPSLGFRYIPGGTKPNPIPAEAQGKSNGSTFDPGTDLDGDASPDFWVSIRDDDDERPMGIVTDDPARDNNETIIIRSECTNPAYALTQGGEQVNVALESVFTHIQGSSGYGTAARTSNAPDLVGGR
jgi:hypothetical protein